MKSNRRLMPLLALVLLVHSSPAAAQVVLEPQAISDAATKLDVLTLLVPKGWTVQPRVLWRPNQAIFVTHASAVFDPQTGRCVRWFPQDRFNCSPLLYNNARQQGAQPVSSGMELTGGVPTAAQYIQQIVVPRYLKTPGIELLSVQDLPDLADAVTKARTIDIQTMQRMGQSIRYLAAKARLRIKQPDKPTVFEEDVYCLLAVCWSEQANATARQVTGAAGESYLFWPEELYGLSAPQGDLDKATPLLRTIYSSNRPTLRWTAFIANLQAMMQQAAMNDHMVARAAQAEINASQRQSFDERSGMLDRQSQAVGHLLRNTQDYKNPDPDKPNFTLPPDVTAWTNGSGAVFYVDKLSKTNPTNAGLDGNWTALEPIK